ncbi:MAG TPA: FG-GAP-like repeat-containing protein [Tepidisphaeraceae bacterium]|nr:FG-GAP-like repeat-containing protein [Tepidisphaeraceae bacterium]
MLTASATGLTDGSGNIVVHDGNLDHITFDVITGPKTAGTAFSATARAFNIANEAIVTYATTGTLTAAGQAGSEPVTPSGAAFTAGVWTGSITLTVADAAVALTMTSGGIAGASSSFAVQAGAVAGFTWGAVSTPQIANVPFGQTITAKDANGNTVTSYNGTVTLSGLAGTTTSQTIMGNSSSTSSSSGLLYTMGFAFTPTATAQITAVRSISGTKVSIWNDTGTLLVSQAVSGTVGTWTETQLTTPITLSANTRYRIAAYMNGQTYYYRSDTPTFSWGAINFSCYSSGDTFPTTTSTGEYLVDLRANVGTFTNVPITPTSATFTSGVWTGNINVSQAATGMHLHVVDAASHIGDSGNFDVIQRTLTLSLPSDVREDDGTVNGLLSVSPTPNADLVISLASSDPSRLSVPATITIPAGQTSVPLPLTILDDNLLNGLEGITITATLATYASTPAVVNVHDNETAVLSVSVPASAKEGDGIVVGTVTASAAPTSDVVIQLSSGKPGRASVPATVVLKAGQTTASFNISIIDNTVIDGTQFVSIGAAADNWTSGFKSISVQDNDNTITLTLPASGWEGQTFSGSVAMGGTLSTDLVVNLSSLDTTELTLPATVTIPAGQKTATFTITLPTDGIKDGTQTAGVTATAQGLIAGNGSVLVHDVDLDHLGFDTITGPKSAGVAFVVTARAMNIANESIVTYTGAGTLGAFGQAGGSLTLTPTSLTFTAGVWTGNATIVAVDPAATLKATVGSLSATSNSFVMQAGPVASFTWNTIGSTQTVNQPFGVTVTAKDANGFVATGYNGTSTLSGQIGTTSSQTLLNGLTYTSSSSGTFTLGYAFTPNTLATVTAVRSMFGTKVSIWTDTGTLLASQTVSGAAGQWTETALTTPITLQAGTRYRISEYTGGGSYFWRNDLPTMPWATDGGGYFFAGDGFPSSTSSGFYMVDLRADVGSFTSIPVTPTSATFSNGVWTGNVTVTQPGNSVHLHIDDGLAHIGDSGVFNVNPTVSPIPQTPDLLAVTDSGSSTTDNITNFNNAAVAKALQFSVGGTTSGATVTIYADGVAIGSTVASGATTTVTTNGTTKLTDGVRSITARQTLSGLPESLDSTALSITVDTVAPTAPVAPVLQAASDSGVSNSDGVTNQNKPTFNVAAGEAGVLHLSVAGTTSFSASTTVAGAGTYPLLLSGAGTIPGGYSTTLAYSGVPAPRQVLIGDINGDGKQDVVVLSAGGVITPMLYLGGGAFQALAPFTVAAGATADGLLVDVDKDNKLDLVVAAGNGAAVFRGKGDGSFLAETTLGTLGAASNTIGVADFNGDGKPDIVVGTNGGAGAIPLARYFGNGDGTFGAPAAMPTTSITITAVYVLGTGDFDKDGKQDVAVICAQTSTPNYPYEWTPLLGDGAGGARTTMGSLYTQKPTAMAIADYNNDGWLDFAIAQPLRIDIDFAYTATSPMQWISGVYVATTNTPDHLSAMDVDGDGQNDIVATQGGAMFYGLSKCAPNYYEFGAAQTMSVSQSASGVVSGLFTGTKRDILAVNPATNSLLMLPGNTFTALAALPDGTYQATAWAEDLAGNASPISTASPITIDTAGPTVQLTAISPNPRSTPVDADTLQFNEAIAGLTKGSFTLTLSGGANLLDGSQTIVGPDKINWTIGNLTGLTGAGGDYILSLTKAGITDLAGNPLSAGASVQWTCNPPATQTLSIDGTSGDDTIYLNMDAAGQNLQVWINASTSGAPTATYPVSGFNAVVVNAGDGNDTVTLDLTNGAIAAANGITVNGGNGTGDSLIVQLPDSGGAATVGASSINITTPAADGVGYAAVESLTITGGAGNDTVTQAAQPIASFWFNGGGNGNDTLNVSAGTYSCAVAQQLAALNITAPGKVLVQPSDAGALNFGAIALSGSGPLLDLANNTALLKAALSDIEAYIQNGCIMTSSAGLSVGVADIGSGKIKVMGTYSGDGNLDGTVNVGDLGLLATHYGTSTANHWSTGDFDGNGVVDVADLGALATHYGQTVPTAGGGGAAALAQPASLISTSAQDPFGKKTITDQSLVDAVEALID